jgi:hypothetical protein
VHGVLDRTEQQVQEIGRGRRVFPFNHLRVHVAAGPKDKEARARVVAVFEGPPTLSERIVERLRAAGCAVRNVTTEVVFARARGADWASPDFHVQFEHVTLASAAPAAVDPVQAASAALRLTVLSGKAQQRVYVFKGGRIDIGRRAEVFDQNHRLIRTNHVAFLDEGADQNVTVSRRHAHIDFNEAQGCYRLWDDRSSHGTSIIRNGRTIRVPPGTRGTRLEAGDEIVLGGARLKVSFAAPAAIR